MTEQAKVSADVGARLREAEQRNQAAKVDAVIAEALRSGNWPGLRRLASDLFPEEPARAAELERILGDFGARVALAAFREAEKLYGLGSAGRALVLDGRGGAEVIADPTAQIGGAP